MASFLLLLFFIDVLLIVLINSIEGFLLLILLLPWTLIIYALLCFQGIRFTTDDPIQQLAGKLFWIGRGNVQASIITIINVVLGILIVSNSNLELFEENFGIFTSTLIFLILPLPGFFINSFQTENQEKLYALIYQEMIGSGKKPEFIDQTLELLQRKDRYSKEYLEELEKVKNHTYQFLEQNFQQISTYFDQMKPLRLNSESLAVFLAKKTIEILDF
ncbi:MAG: hypothetical protein ACXACU_08910 [Candidatus Hodarchaeales archaeon]